MSKIARGVRAFRFDEIAPRFLLVLTGQRSRSGEEPAKSNAAIETAVLILFCLMLAAIVVITFEKVRHG